jgi:hypothetical protein
MVSEAIMIIPDLAAEPTVRAALQLDRARRKPIALRKKLLLVVTLPIGCFFLVQGLALTGTSQGDPIADLATGLLRGLYFLGALSCFYLSLRAFFALKKSRE